MKKGFTLIELCVVMVIIGLIIGGVLIGQSLLGASKISGAAIQIQQFDSAVMAYRTKFRGLPGDSIPSGGDGDKWIESNSNSVTPYVDYFACEIANFWSSLDPTKYTSSTCTAAGVRPTPTGTTPNVPLSKLGEKNSYFMASAAGTSGGVYTDRKWNYYHILPQEQAQTLLAGKYAFSATYVGSVTIGDLAALDIKIDDGGPGKGYVRTSSPSISINGAYFWINENSASTYNAFGMQSMTTPVIRIGSTSKDPM